MLYLEKSAKARRTDVLRNKHDDSDSEIGPVLLQLGVVHVNCEKLEADTGTSVSMRKVIWTLRQDNRTDMACVPQNMVVL